MNNQFSIKYFQDKLGYIVLVIETTNEADDKQTIKLINKAINNGTLWGFNKVFITNKINKNMEPVLGNELVDFVCYSYFQWANNSLFHNSKFLLHNYPNHYKNSLSLIDNFEFI